jgi:hypothetical protein
MKSKVQNPRDKCINSLETNQNVKQVLIKLIFINGNEKRVATPPPKFYLKYPCFPTKDTPQASVKCG